MLNKEFEEFDIFYPNENGIMNSIKALHNQNPTQEGKIMIFIFRNC